jgi:hypothetical protein
MAVRFSVLVRHCIQDSHDVAGETMALRTLDSTPVLVATPVTKPRTPVRLALPRESF